jgi:putative transposase
MLMTEHVYPSDLTDEQWNAIKELIPNARRGGRPRTTSIRKIINAVFYINRTGCAWRYLPINFPVWQTVYDYYRKWMRLGIWRKIHDALRTRLRKSPSTLIIDSQSIKAAKGEDRGYDGFKGIRGRKRQILVDTLGMIHAIKVHSAGYGDMILGHLTFDDLLTRKNLKQIYADKGYRKTFVENTEREFGFKPNIPKVRKTSGQGKRKKVKYKRANRKLRNDTPKRWIVERTFAWFSHYRRLSKDYERSTNSSSTMIYLSMTQLILRRLYPSVL